MKVVITGGHFSPALSVIRKLEKGNDILIVGRKAAFEGDSTPSYEFTVAEKNNIPFKEVKAARLQRKITGYTLSSLVRFPKGIFQARKILREYKPDVVLTFGGYIGLSVALAANTLGIPVILHEQTQHAGLSAKIIGKFAKKICISFASSKKYFPEEKTILTGNPIREEVFKENTSFSLPSSLPVIYVTGGSTGAHAINMLITQIIEKLLEKYVVIHQTGKSKLTNDFETISSLQKKLPDSLKKRYIVKPYVLPEEIGFVMKHADLIVGRAGINTVSEILALGKMSLLVPLPHGQKGEQLENAKLVKRIGIGEYLIQDTTTPEILLEKIDAMIKEKPAYLKHKDEAKELIAPDAADKIVSALLQVIS